MTGGFVTCVMIARCGTDKMQWGAIKLWDIGTGRTVRTMDDYLKSVEAIAVSPDLRTAVGVANENVIKVWDLTTGRLVRSLTGNLTTIESPAISPDGRLVAGGSESEAKVWDLATGELLVSFVSSEDGEWIAITPEGFFNASAKGAELLYLVNGLQTVTVDQLYQSLFRPDLVREKLAGDPRGLVREAAANLDLNKVIASGSGCSPRAGWLCRAELSAQARRQARESPRKPRSPIGAAELAASNGASTA